MISKKKLTAIVVAGLFVTPVMAHHFESDGDIGDGSGQLTANDAVLKEAMSKKDYKGIINVTIFGKRDDARNGVIDFTLTDSTGYKLTALNFDGSSGLDTTHHKTNLTLQNTKLELAEGVFFSNASKFTKNDGKVDTSKLPKPEDVSANNTFKLEGSTLTGNISHYYTSFGEGTHYYVNSLSTQTAVELSKSNWTGDLRDYINEVTTNNSTPVTADTIASKFNVTLKDGSSWTGGVDIAKNSTIEVTLDETSSWTVNKDSKVNSIQFNGATAAFKAAAEKNGVVLADGVTLTVADGINGNTNTNTINNLHTGAGSTLAVEKANVTLNNFAGKGDIVLNKDGKVEVKAASDKVNATFTSLEGSKFTTTDKVDANVTIAGALVDEKGMDAVIAEYNKNNNYTGNGTVTFSGGLINDTVTGKNDAQGNFVVQNVQKNAQLVSIGESTAITMMQWRADADDMAQRMGDLRNNNGSVGVWARTFGGKAEAGHVDNKYYGVQAGVDTQVATTGPKQFVGGAVSYTTGDATFANGTGDNYMGTFTGYSTWLFDNGSYVDVAAKVGKLNNEFDLAVEGQKLAGKYSTQAVALTVESGHRFPITNLTYVEPQVAFTASHIFGEDYGATNGVTIEQDSINSYVARVGVQAGLNCPDNMGSVFVRASYLYDFDGETSTVAHKANAMDGNRFDQDFGGGWYELGLGMNVNFTKNLYGYADFEYVTGGEIKTPYRWNAGVRYAF